MSTLRGVGSVAHEPAAGGVPDVDLELLAAAQACIRLLRDRERPPDALIAAWERFHADYGPLVRRAVVRCPIRRSDVDDCIQEAWAEIWVRLPEFVYDPARGRFCGWLHTVVHRKTMEHVRRSARITARCTAGPGEFARLLSPRCAEPDACCLLRESRMRIRRALAEFRNHVSRTAFRVLCLASLRGCSMPEIAERLDLTVEQVWAHHCRAKRRFREWLRTRGVVEWLP